MVHIDGSRGEGGGQILRTALALSMVTGRPCELVRVRSRRDRPGLMKQHLTALEAAAAVSGAQVQGAALGSETIVFRPGRIRAGSYEFSVGSAGSATLVLQTVLPALLAVDEPSRLVLEGGTHNPKAPPFDFVEGAFAPVLRQMGVGLDLWLVRHGFHPAGGGRFEAEIRPPARDDPERTDVALPPRFRPPIPGLRPLHLEERGEIVRRRVYSAVANLPDNICERETSVVTGLLEWPPDVVQTEVLQRIDGRGNYCIVDIECEQAREVFVGFGRAGVRAEKVARVLAGETRRWLEADVPVGQHLADQLLLPFALAGGGRFRTLPPTKHTTTTAKIIRQFLGISIHIDEDDEGTATVEVG